MIAEETLLDRVLRKTTRKPTCRCEKCGTAWQQLKARAGDAFGWFNGLFDNHEAALLWPLAVAGVLVCAVIVWLAYAPDFLPAASAPLPSPGAASSLVSPKAAPSNGTFHHGD